MKRIEKPTVFKTFDGQEFTSEANAALHEQAITLRDTYWRAMHAYGDFVANHTSTADGIPFKIGSWCEYFYMPEWYGQKPTILTVSFHYDNYQYHLSEYEQTGVIRIHYTDKARGLDMQIPVGDLYAKRSNADAALVARMEQYIAKLTGDVAAMRKDVQSCTS